jgi:hypothetical protein
MLGENSTPTMRARSRGATVGLEVRGIESIIDPALLSSHHGMTSVLAPLGLAPGPAAGILS